jgi:uncharacterized membrane protein
MRHRMAAAGLALIGLLVSIYLLLYKVGVVGSLRCVGSGGCERVNTSSWSSFLGVPVAAFGVAGYLVLLGVAMYGLRADQLERPRATGWLAVLSAVGVLFSLYLLALELFVIHAVCLWCTVSGVTILAIFVVSAAALRRPSRAPAP